MISFCAILRMVTETLHLTIWGLCTFHLVVGLATEGAAKTVQNLLRKKDHRQSRTAINFNRRVIVVYYLIDLNIDYQKLCLLPQ